MQHSQEVSQLDWAVEFFTIVINGDFILPYLLTWVMIYSFGINIDFGIYLNLILHIANSGNFINFFVNC